MKKAVPKSVCLQPGDGRGGMIAFACEHVVPLQDLVEQDAIHEAAEADAQ
jgi:hypothetical protein